MSKDQLQNVRESIASNLEEFESLRKEKNFKKHFNEIRGEKNKRLSNEFKTVVEKEPLIANKQFYYFGDIDIKKILSKNLTNDLMKYYFAAKPMNSFLKEALS